MTDTVKISRPRVCVWYRGIGQWCVGMQGSLIMAPDQLRTIYLATYKTRDSANAYAKGLRAALRADR